LARLLAVSIALGACSSTDATPAQDSVDAAPAENAAETTPSSGPMDERFDDSTAVDVVTSFVSAWRSEDFATIARSFDTDASHIIGRELNNGSIAQLSRPGHYLDISSLSSEFGANSFSYVVAELLAAIDQAGASAVDLDHPVDTISAIDATTVEVTFSSREPVRFTTNEGENGWRVRRIDEVATVDPGDIFGMADPTEGTGWTWCGHDEPVVLDGVDCQRVQAGLAGIAPEQQAEIDELREQSLDDPSKSLDLTQAMQRILGAAPGQVCRLLQRGQVPAGEATENARTVSANVCPAFESLALQTLNYDGWRYGELELVSPQAAVEQFVAAWNRNDWWDVHFVLGPGAHDDFFMAYGRLSIENLVADPQLVDLNATPAGNSFVDLFEQAEPVVSIGELTGPIEEVQAGEVLQADTTNGTVTFAVEQAPSGRWRVRAIAEGADVDPNGPLFQPAT
jgi:hypothetical protein